MSTVAIKTSAELLHERRREPDPCADRLILALPWVAKKANIGTLIRTADAVGACIAVARTPVVRKAMARGNTIGTDKVCTHWLTTTAPWEDGGGALSWLWNARCAGYRVVAIEAAHGAVPLTDLRPSAQRTIVVLGHEVQGIPDVVLRVANVVAEIPMRGVGNSLNVAVAGSLAAYQLTDFGGVA